MSLCASVPRELDDVIPFGSSRSPPSTCDVPSSPSRNDPGLFILTLARVVFNGNPVRQFSLWPAP